MQWNLRARVMAWWPECLFGQALGPEVEPQYPHKSGHWLCTPIITELGGGDTGISMERVGSSQVQWETLSNTTWREREWHSVSATGLCEHMCGCMCLPLRQNSFVTENRKNETRARDERSYLYLWNFTKHGILFKTWKSFLKKITKKYALQHPEQGRVAGRRNVTSWLTRSQDLLSLIINQEN